jgi:hypothetical protein
MFATDSLSHLLVKTDPPSNAAYQIVPSGHVVIIICHCQQLGVNGVFFCTMLMAAIDLVSNS